MSKNSSIMIVDDNPGSLGLLINTLTAEGYRVYVAESGTLAIDFAIATPPDMIILDVHMPGMGGFEVLGKLKENQKTNGIPVILIGIANDAAERIKGLRTGAADYVFKPYYPEELIIRIQNHLELARIKSNRKQ